MNGTSDLHFAIDELNQQAWEWLQSEPDRALRAAEEALRKSIEQNYLHGQSHARLALALHETRQGDVRAGIARLGQIADDCARHGDHVGYLRANLGVAQAELGHGEAERARTRLHTLLQQAEANLQVPDYAALLNTLSIAEHNVGNATEGLRLAYQALAALGPYPYNAITAFLSHNIGVYQLNVGNDDLAHKLLSDALIAIHAAGSRTQIALFTANLALCQLNRNESAQALDLVVARIHLGSDDVTPRDYGFLLAVAAHACTRLQRWDEAVEYHSQARHYLKDEDAPFFAGYLAYLAALLAQHAGVLPEALRQTSVAHEAARLSHDDQLLLNTLSLQAELQAQAGEHQRAYELHREFHTHYHRLTDTANETRYLTLQVQYELQEAKAARDIAQHDHAETEAARQALAALNQELADRLADIEALQAALREQAIRDPLTGLYNRRHLSEALPQVLQLAIRENWSVCVALIDLDNFKRLNDSHGHGMGDAALVHLAQVLRDGIRGSDFCCRYGGEEFCIVFAPISIDAAHTRLHQLLQAFAGATIVDGEQNVSGLTFSAGIASSLHHGLDSQSLLRAADIALYRAKDSGRNQVLVAVQE